MSQIGLYVFKQALKPFLFIIGIALILLLVERMLRLLDQVLGFGGSPLLLMEMLAFLVPHYMALALPAGFFLGVLLAFNGMHQRSELDALHSAGVSLYGLLRPILLSACLLALVTALNASYVQPYSRYIYRSLVHFIAETSIVGHLQERTAIQVGDYTFLADHERPGGRQFGRIFIYEEHGSGGSTTTTAEAARLLTAIEDRRLVLSLTNGVRMKLVSVTPQGREGGDEGGVFGPDSGTEELVFDQVDIPIEIDGRDVFRDRGQDERELTFFELWNLRHTPPLGATGDEMMAELNDHLVRALSILFLPFLAVGLAIGQRRTHRAYNIAFGVIAIIVYNEILSVGKFSSADARLSPLYGQWMPFFAFVVVSVVFFHRTALKVPKGQRMEAALLWLEGFGREQWSKLTARRSF
ncbi:MAG: LptF/LptG family permease [Alphaproteobacteria bacterium]|nr:LptF/LptG family permease [Alphaproteobacteria bacterium]